MSDKKTLPVRIHGGFMEIGRFDHVAVYSGLRGRRRSYSRTGLTNNRVRCLSLVLDYAGGVQVAGDFHRHLADVLSRLTLLISSKPTDNIRMVRMYFVVLCVA